MLCFVDLEPAFCLSNIAFLTAPKTSLMDDLGHLRAVELVFVREKKIQCDECFEKELEGQSTHV